MNKICQNCGKEFASDHASAKYCSTECYRIAIAGLSPELNQFSKEFAIILEKLPLQTWEDPTPYKYEPTENFTIPKVISVKTNKGKLEATITITISDLHISCTTFLPNTWYSAMARAMQLIRTLRKEYTIVKVRVVFNGDIVSGNNVYPLQIFDNIIQREHWMVIVAVEMVKEIKRFIAEAAEQVPELYFVKGTHEREDNNYMINLSKLVGGRYISRYGILNIAEPIGYYNIMFTHGKGSSDSSPVSLKTIRETKDLMLQKALEGTRIERVNVGHTHWLSIMDQYSVSGGFQKYEPALVQRPSGILVDVFAGGLNRTECVKPSTEVERKEKNSNMLEFTNFLFYAVKLIKSLEHESGVNGKTLEDLKKMVSRWWIPKP